VVICYRYFREQPLHAAGVDSEKLILWYFEDELKQRYLAFIQALEIASKDTVAHIRELSIKSLYELLSSKPEQEQTILTLMVNKLVCRACACSLSV
jgi:ribosome biogenesis protein MAK21